MKTYLAAAALAASPFLCGVAHAYEGLYGSVELGYDWQKYDARGSRDDANRVSIGGVMNYGFNGGFNVQGDLKLVHLGSLVDNSSVKGTLHALYKNKNLAVGAFAGFRQSESEPGDDYNGYFEDGEEDSFLIGPEFAWMFENSTIQFAIGGGKRSRSNRFYFDPDFFDPDQYYERTYEYNDTLGGFNLEYRIFATQDLRIDLHAAGLGYLDEELEDDYTSDDVDVDTQLGFDVEWRPGRIPFSIEAGYDWIKDSTSDTDFSAHVVGLTLRYNFGPNDPLRVRERNGVTFDPMGGFQLLDNWW